MVVAVAVAVVIVVVKVVRDSVDGVEGVDGVLCKNDDDNDLLKSLAGRTVQSRLLLAFGTREWMLCPIRHHVVSQAGCCVSQRVSQRRVRLFRSQQKNGTDRLDELFKFLADLLRISKIGCCHERS